MHGKPELANSAASESSSKMSEVVLIARDEIALLAKSIELNENTWISDIGASCHMTNDDTGMYDVKTIIEDIKIGNRKPMRALKVGKVKVEILQRDDMSLEVVLTNCKLLSIPTALDKDFNIGNKG